MVAPVLKSGKIMWQGTKIVTCSFADFCSWCDANTPSIDVLFGGTFTNPFAVCAACSTYSGSTFTCNYIGGCIWEATGLCNLSGSDDVVRITAQDSDPNVEFLVQIDQGGGARFISGSYFQAKSGGVVDCTLNMTGSMTADAGVGCGTSSATFELNP